MCANRSDLSSIAWVEMIGPGPERFSSIRASVRSAQRVQSRVVPVRWWQDLGVLKWCPAQNRVDRVGFFLLVRCVGVLIRHLLFWRRAAEVP